MKVIGNIIDVLTQDKEVCIGDCKDCALFVRVSGRADCRIPKSMDCPLEDGHCYKVRK